MRWPKILGIALVCVLLVCCVSAFGADNPAGAKSWGSSGVTASAAVAPDKVTPEKGERLGLLQLRRMGLTIRNVAPIVKQLIAEGQVSADDSPSVIAAAVMGEMSKSQAWAEEAKSGKIDWDAILAFLEKLIPLILKFV